MSTLARKPQDAATVTAAILSILDALAGVPAGSPGAAAFKAALRRKGENLAALGGVEALRQARDAAATAAPDRAEARAALIDAAWAAIPGWTAAGDTA